VLRWVKRRNATRPGSRPLALLLLSTLAARVWLAWRYEGFLTGDDLEIVQSAAKYALGVTYQPWSLRCLFHPIVLVAPAMKLAALFGARDPGVLRWVATLPTAAFATAAIGLTAALARRWGWPPRAAAAAAFFYALAWMPLAYGATPFPRPISTAMLLAAFLLAADPGDRAAAPLAAGLLAGTAFAVRWSEGVVLVPLCAWTAWRFRGARRVLLILAGFAAGTLLFAGVTDWLTWGTPLKSLAEYFRIMYLERPDVDDQPLYEYFYDVFHWAGPLLILLLIPAWKERRARSAIAVFASIVTLLSLFSHKEWRYLQAGIPFLALAAGAGWERLRARGRRFLAASALVLAVPYGFERSVALLSHASTAGIDASRFIKGLRPQPRVLAIEQIWAYGEHFYLGNGVEIREIELDRPLRPPAIRAAASGADIAAVYAMHLDEAGRRELESLGFRQIADFRKRRAYECLVFGRGPFAGGAAGRPDGTSETRQPEAPAATAPPRF
jgi:glycosyl transferase family 22 (putative mannosyltransferase)